MEHEARVNKFIELVKSQIRHHRWVLENAPTERLNEDKHRYLILRWEDFVSFLEGLTKEGYSELKPAKSVSSETAQESEAVISYLGDISDLPEEIQSDLGLNAKDQLETQIVQVIDEARRPLPVPEIVAGLYRKFRVIAKKKFVAQKIYRMVSRKGLLYGVPGKKGFYSTSKIS